MKIADLFNVQGHVALVTGASSGIGLAFAEVMAENGATVVLTCHNADRLAQQTERLRAMGLKVESKVVDVADADALRAAIDGTAEAHGRLDAVFANAGIGAGPGFMLSPGGSITDYDRAAFDRSMDVNLHGGMNTIAFAARHMKERRSGSIIVTLSVAGLMAEPITGYGYIASKAAMGNVVRQAAIDLARWNVRVNGIAPGPFLTNIGGGRLHTEPQRRKMFADGVPLGRLAMPDEIKGLGLLLASPAGSYLTGTVIPIDGGSTAVLPGRAMAVEN